MYKRINEIASQLQKIRIISKLIKPKLKIATRLLYHSRFTENLFHF